MRSVPKTVYQSRAQTPLSNKKNYHGEASSTSWASTHFASSATQQCSKHVATHLLDKCWDTQRDTKLYTAVMDVANVIINDLAISVVLTTFWQ